LTPDALGLSGAGQILATLEDRGHIFKYTRSRLQVIQFGLGKPNVPQPYAGLVKEDSYQTIGSRYGRERSNTAFTMLKMQCWLPRQSQHQDSTIVNVGFLTSMRKP